jgi:5-methylcytosine-specific restriction endonuclease McrA
MDFIVDNQQNDMHFKICFICKDEANSPDIFLTNGNSIHESCLSNKFIPEEISNFRAEISSLEQKLSDLYKLNYFNIFSKISNYSKYNTTRNSLVQEIQFKKRELLKIQMKSENYLSNIKAECYDFWPTYPPDWKIRRSFVINSICNDCAKYPSIHAHHLIPLTCGGSNKRENLEALCEMCHERRHFHKFNENDIIITKSSSIPNEYTYLKIALSSKQPIDIEYTNKFGEITRRKILPIEFIQKYYAIEAYCYKRAAHRYFKIARIKKI